MFHERLSILLKISDVSNSQIARHLNLDTSYISKLKNGKRNLPKNHDFLKPLIGYTLKNIKTNHQSAALNALIGLKDVDIPNDEYVEFVYTWLMSRDSIANNKSDKYIPIQDASSSISNHIERRESKVFYGDEGKRKAVLLFLKKVLKNKKTVNLYFVTDEPLNWIYSNPMFAKEWK